MQSNADKARHYDRLAPERDHWRRRNHYYYDDLEGFLGFLVPPGHKVLDIGCATGHLLERLRPRRGLGVDLSPGMVEQARRVHPAAEHPDLEYRVDDVEKLATAETFDYVIMSDTIGELDDVWSALRNLRQVSHDDCRIIITYFNALWEPVLRLGERLGLKMPQSPQNWLALEDIRGLLELNGFEVIKSGYRLPLPLGIPLVSTVVNRFLGKLPLIRKLGLVVYIVARRRPGETQRAATETVSVVVPCRNELGNVRGAVERIPPMGAHTEILFVDGNSTDGTVQAIEELMDEYRGRKDIKLIHQVAPGSADGAGHGRMLKLGKGDAVRKGFAAASGNVLMILDADLTVPPEDLPKFYLALTEGRGELINGTRLVYPMEREAMRTLNKLGNKLFSLVFTWLLDQRIKDTLCGTKVLRKTDYEKICAQREFFGDFDPFGDFDLLFGAAKQNLRIVEVPVRYRQRTYGEIKIQRFRHGLLLLKMSLVAMLKLKLS